MHWFLLLTFVSLLFTTFGSIYVHVKLIENWNPLKLCWVGLIGECHQCMISLNGIMIRIILFIFTANPLNVGASFTGVARFERCANIPDHDATIYINYTRRGEVVASILSVDGKEALAVSHKEGMYNFAKVHKSQQIHDLIDHTAVMLRWPSDWLTVCIHAMQLLLFWLCEGTWSDWLPPLSPYPDSSFSLSKLENVFSNFQ